MLTANSLINPEEIAAKAWFCNKCQISNMAQLFPFGLQNNHDLQNIMNPESLKFLENLPSYKTTSKAYSIDSLSQSDVDENIITDINSRYYSANEFKTIKNNNLFNILHSNLNDLESKFGGISPFSSITLKWTLIFYVFMCFFLCIYVFM